MWLVDIEVQHWWLCNFNILLIPQPSLTIQPIHSDKHQTIISLLQSGHSCRQIARKTGISKSTIGRIAKKVETIKENITTGCPSKLSPLDKRRIIYQIESGKLDNAVQATDYINSINTHPISSQTVRNALKKDNMKAVVKKNNLSSSQFTGRTIGLCSDLSTLVGWRLEEGGLVIWDQNQ